MLRYSNFVPRLYNLCLQLGFNPGKIMPSRAFCSDESQGYPIILLSKHFGTFPFDHGRVGGIMATDRHGPHAHHGQDLVIIQASHVGYSQKSRSFGRYERLQTAPREFSHNCGKIHAVINRYVQEYDFVKENIFLEHENNKMLVSLDNNLLSSERNDGLCLNFEKLLGTSDLESLVPVKSLSTAKSYMIPDKLLVWIPASKWPKEGQRIPMGNLLHPQLFHFKRAHIAQDNEGFDHLENNLLAYMNWIVTSQSPMLAAAKVNSQVEFNRTFRTMQYESEYQGKNLLYISGLNIDISPQEGQLFPLTKFVPWAAYLQRKDGSHEIIEQDELFALLMKQSDENTSKMDLTEAIHAMEKVKEVKVKVI
jgi:hypothetical protein